LFFQLRTHSAVAIARAQAGKASFIPIPKSWAARPCLSERAFRCKLIDSLEGGESIEDFLDGFPSVKREQVIAVIGAAKLRMLETV
jgi:hypothetical protein